MTPLRIRDPVEPLLHLRDAGGVGVERVGEPTDVAPDLAQADDEVAQLAGRGLELGREPLERRERPLGGRGERAGALPVVRLDRRHGGLGALAELGDVPHPLAFGAERVLLARLEPVGVLDERLELGEPRPLGVGAALELVEPPVAAARPRQASRASPRRTRCSGPTNASSRSSWWDGRASRRCSNWPEIASSRSVAATRSSRATLRPHAYARERPSAKTRRATTSPGSSSGRSSRSGSSPSSSKNPSGTSSSASTYASEPAAPTERGVALRAEQEPDRLREDRLPGAGLAGERDEPRAELEVRLADEDEVLDPQPCAARRDRSTGRPSPHSCPRGRSSTPRGGVRSRSSRGSGSRTSPRGASRGACALAPRRIVDAPARPRLADPVPVDEHDGRRRPACGSRRATSFPRGTTSGRAWSECGATNVVAIASIPHISTGPPFERL